MTQKYSMEDVVAECQQIAGAFSDKAEKDGASITNISNIFTGFFKQLGLEAEWKALKTGRSYSFSERQKEILVEIYVHRKDLEIRGNLKRDKGLDIDLLYYILNNVLELFDVKPPLKESEIFMKLEGYMTRILTSNFSSELQNYFKILLENKFNNETISTDKEHYLRSYDRYLWKKALEFDLLRLVRRWKAIFEEMESLCKELTENEVEDQYLQNYYTMNLRVKKMIEEQLKKNKKYKQLIKKYNSCSCETDRQEIANKLKIMLERIIDECRAAVVNSYPIPYGYAPGELLTIAMGRVLDSRLEDYYDLRDPRDLMDFLGFQAEKDNT